MKQVFIDCTELYGNPVRTGIQRVVRELLRHWPVSGPPVEIVRFDAQYGLINVPTPAVRLLSDEDPAALKMPHAELVQAIARAGAAGRPVDPPRGTSIFLPELFYDPARCQFYWRRVVDNPGQVSLLIFDFLPILYPQIFNLPSAAPFMHYLHLVQRVQHIAHISERTRREYATRVMRMTASSNGIVLPLGGDGLSLEHQTWHAGRRGFVVLGSLDGWKNQDVVVAAFLKLWEAGLDVPLTLIGRTHHGVDLSWLEPARAYPQFRWLSNASDNDVMAELRNTIATIYLPELAGFGLPPIESLHAGIPVITLTDMPSLDGFPPDGQVRLSRAETELVADAVSQLMDSAASIALWQEATALSVPTWKDFAVRTAGWLDTM